MKQPLAFAPLLLVVQLVGCGGCTYNGQPIPFNAMCCTEYKNGNCVRWQNCCHILAPDSGDETADTDTLPPALTLVAPEDCVKSCRCTVTAPERAACLSSCASPPPDGSALWGCVKLYGTESGYDPQAVCCVDGDGDDDGPGRPGPGSNPTGPKPTGPRHDVRRHDNGRRLDRKMCPHSWRNCREVEKMMSSGDDPNLTLYWPHADGACASRCRESGTTGTSRYDCYSRCAFPGGSGFDDFVTPPLYNTPTASGSATAYVPMKHGSCGLDCGTHVLATENGNLDMKLWVGMHCSNGNDKVTHFVLIAGGQEYEIIAPPAQEDSPFMKEVTAKPFTLNNLELGCREALGGNWALPDPHKNSEQSVVTLIKTTVTVKAKCDNWANFVTRNYEILLSPTTCFDKNWFEPPP